MDSFLQFFEQAPAWQKGLWVFGCLTAGWLAEIARPMFRTPYDKWRHARVNFFFLATTLAINLGFTFASLPVFAWVNANSVGVLHRVALPIWLELVIAVLLLDLVSQYAVHFLLHKVPILWRFHQVHHSDVNVDVTTGTRHHPGDYVVRELFALAAIVIIGMPLAFYLVYRMMTVLFTYATHANVELPRVVDRPLSWLFVTPRLHKFHHHRQRPWTDSNYGNIFSLWDRSFGTLVGGDASTVRYGLDSLPDASASNLSFQLKVPFLRR